MKTLYQLHSPRDHFYGDADSRPLPSVINLAKYLGLNMVERHIPDGLNSFEERNPNKAVIFDVASEDVVMVEEGSI